MTLSSGSGFESYEIDAVLGADPAVDACVVRYREAVSGEGRFVAYVVPSGAHSLDSLADHLEETLPRLRGSWILAPLAGIPLTPGGQIDEEALARLPVVEGEVAERWERAIEDCGAVQRVAVAISAGGDEVPRLHLADVLPGWSGGAASAQPTGEESAPPAPREPVVAADPRRPAIASGPPLRSTGEPTHLAEALEKAAREHGEAGVVHVRADGERRHSYPELWELARRTQAGLAAEGVRPGAHVLFQIESSAEFIPAFWGCVLAGVVPVPIAIPRSFDASDASVQKLHNAWEMFDRPLVLTTEEHRSDLESLSVKLDFDGFDLEVATDLAGHEPAPQPHAPNPEDPALIVLTSGSTGQPKGVVLSHRNLLSMAIGTAQQNAFTCDDVTLNWMPLEHVGAISFLHTMAVYLGCLQVHAPTDLVLPKPLRWLDWIDRFGATITWGPNFAFSLINDREEEIKAHSWDLSSMRFLVSAGEAVVSGTTRRFLELMAIHGLSPSAVHPAFGMSETCSGITWSDSFTRESVSEDSGPADLGPPIPGATLRMVDAEGRTVMEGEIGRLQLKGPSLTAGYYRNPEANRKAFTADGWFDTGDLGFLRDGRLTLTGREKDEIVIKGINYAGAEIEELVESIPDIESSYTAACAVRAPGSEVEDLAIFFTPSSADDRALRTLLLSIRQKVAKAMGIAPTYLIPLRAEDVPKTAIGKIQRSELRARFANGELSSIIKRVDLLSQNANTLPDWFYRRVWRPKELVDHGAPLRSGCALVYADEGELAEVLAARLGEVAQHVVRVETGSSFEELSPDRFRIAPAEMDHHGRLFDRLRGQGHHIDLVLHLWTHDRGRRAADDETVEELLRHGSYAVLGTLQAFERGRASADTLRLHVISSGAQLVEPGDPVCCEQAAMLGLLKTAPREIPGLGAFHLDLPPASPEESANWILRELRAERGDREVARRAGRRLVCQLERVDVTAPHGAPPFFEEGGIYAISGGLGELGLLVARDLLETHRARLLLLDRRELPEDADPERDDSRAGDRAALAKLGGEVLYHAVDVCDREAVAAAVADAESRWGGRLTGVIHLAGSFHQCPIVEESLESFREAIAAKVHGTRVLHDILAQRGAGAFVSFGSVNAFFGGAGYAAYAVANSFLSSFSDWQVRETPIRSHCLEWSMWDDMGISRGYGARELSRAQGFHALTARQGIASLRIGLRSHDPRLLIGLDGSNANVRRLVNEDDAPLRALRAYVTLASDTGRQALEELPDLPDRFGTPVTCELVEVPEMPVDAAGHVDVGQLEQLHGVSGASGGPHVAPSTDLERRIAAVWKEVLGVSDVSIHDNFFALGGDSLRAATVMNRLQEHLGTVLHVVALFDAPTVAELAVEIEERYASDGEAAALDRTAPGARRVDAERARRMRELIASRPPRRKRGGARNRRAVFVLSPPRSGSTLLRVMLGGHPQIFAPPELHLLAFDSLAERSATFSGPQSFWKDGTTRAIMELCSCDAAEATRRMEASERDDLSTQRFYARLQEWAGDRILVDKTPTYALEVEVLRRAESDFEDALYIHLLRHPYGMIRSFDEARLDQLLYAYMPRLRGGERAPFSRVELAELSWLICQENILAFQEEVPGRRWHRVRFEDLVREPERITRGICDFLELEFHARMLDPYAGGHERMTDGVHEVSRMLGDLKFHQHHHIDPAVAETWKNEYTVDFLGDPTWSVAEALGYTERAVGVSTERSDGVSTSDEELLAKVDEMSDEEVEKLLAEMSAERDGGSK